MPKDTRSPMTTSATHSRRPIASVLRRASRARLLACALAVASGAVAMPRASSQGAGVSGVVFLDANANGRRDAGETGLQGVAVSNQVDVAATGEDGTYRLPGRGTGVVSVSVPNGFRSPGPFWKRLSDAVADFSLVRDTA